VDSLANERKKKTTKLVYKDGIFKQTFIIKFTLLIVLS